MPLSHAKVREGSRWLFFILFVILAVSCFFRTVHVDLDFKVFHHAAQQFVSGSNDFYPGSDAPMGIFTYKYSPIFPALMAPFALVDEPHGRFAWAVLNVLFLVLAWYAAERFVRAAGVAVGFPARLLTLLVIADPVTLNAIQGNSNLMLLSFMLAALALSSRQPPTVSSEAAAGTLAGLATSIKLTPGVALVYFAATRKWRPFFWGGSRASSFSFYFLSCSMAPGTP